MGTPMLRAGDEWGRSQQGNDNAYNQDNEILVARLGRKSSPIHAVPWFSGT